MISKGSILSHETLFSFRRTWRSLLISVLRNPKEWERSVLEQESNQILEVLQSDLSLQHVLVDASCASSFSGAVLVFFDRLRSIADERGGKLFFWHLSSGATKALESSGLVAMASVHLL